MPLNTYSNKAPFVAKIKSVEKIVGPKATGETYHIIIETDGKIPFWEGQSYGVIPPVSAASYPACQGIYIAVACSGPSRGCGPLPLGRSQSLGLGFLSKGHSSRGSRARDSGHCAVRSVFGLRQRAPEFERAQHQFVARHFSVARSQHSPRAGPVPHPVRCASDICRAPR